MALSVSAIDVAFFTATPSVSYAAGDWIVFTEIFRGNTPTGSITGVTLTSSGGGALTITSSAAFTNYKFVIGIIQATASGTSTWSQTTSGNVNVIYERGAAVISGADSVAYSFGGFAGFSSAPSISPYGNFSNAAVTLTSPTGLVGIVHGHTQNTSAINVTPTGTEISYVDTTNVDAEDFAIGDISGADEYDEWMGVDLTLSSTTTTYTTTQNVTDWNTPNQGTPVGVLIRMAAWALAVVPTAEEVFPYWGIDARLPT